MLNDHQRRHSAHSVADNGTGVQRNRRLVACKSWPSNDNIRLFCWDSRLPTDEIVSGLCLLFLTSSSSFSSSAVRR